MKTEKEKQEEFDRIWEQVRAEMSIFEVRVSEPEPGEKVTKISHKNGIGFVVHKKEK